jgi:hypothetical protein
MQFGRYVPFRSNLLPSKTAVGTHLPFIRRQIAKDNCLDTAVRPHISHALRVLETRTLKIMFNPKSEDVKGYKKFRNYKLHNLHSVPNIVTKMIRSWRVKFLGVVEMGSS